MPSIPRHRLVLRIRSPSGVCNDAKDVCAACASPHPCEEDAHAPMGSKSPAFRDGRALSQEIYATFGFILEVGYAWGCGVPVVLLTQDHGLISSLMFAVRGALYIAAFGNWRSHSALSWRIFVPTAAV